MTDTDTVRVRVEVDLPWTHGRLVMAYAIPSAVWRDSLTPLPRAREIDPLAAAEAARQMQRRDRLSRLVADAITGAILKAAENEDTTDGYSKRELQR